MQINKPKGVYSASRISELLAGGSGKTRQSYHIDLCLDILGLKEDFDTAPMKHGRVNEINAFDYVKIYHHDAVLCSDEYIPINDKCGASPDVILKNKDVIDIKCPSSLYQFHKSKITTSKAYHDQIQMQLLSTGGNLGRLFYYLTKPEIWGSDEWTEYDFENFDDNHYFVEIKKDEKRQKEILEAVERYYPVKMEILDKMKQASEIEFKELNARIKGGKMFAPIKQASNVLNVDLFKFEDKYFYWYDKK